MSSTAYEIRFAGRLSDKRFANARQLLKDAGATFDAAGKKWTVTIEDGTEKTYTCNGCGGLGHPVLNANAGTRCEDAKCKQYGAHAHAAYTCPDCKGAGAKTVTEHPKAWQHLRTVEQSYGADVTESADQDRAALEAERAQLLARLAEVEKLLA